MRFYSPQLGRFINRDPFEEQGGANLYAFCGNDGINRFDLLGMDGDDDNKKEREQKEQKNDPAPSPAPDPTPAPSPTPTPTPAPEEPVQGEKYVVDGGSRSQRASEQAGRDYQNQQAMLPNSGPIPVFGAQLNFQGSFSMRDANGRIAPTTVRHAQRRMSAFAKTKLVAQLARALINRDPVLKMMLGMSAARVLGLVSAVNEVETLWMSERRLVAQGAGRIQQLEQQQLSQGQTRAFWVGEKDGLPAALASGARVLELSPEAQAALAAGDPALMLQESAAWAEGATGETAQVFYGTGAGRTFKSVELPKLMKNLDNGSLDSITIDF